MNKIRRHCPLCAWFQEDTGPNPQAVQPGALAGVFGPGVFAAHAMNEYNRKVENILKDHFDTHNLEEWVAKVTQLQSQLAAAKVLITDLTSEPPDINSRTLQERAVTFLMETP